ncbi:hypothetical protein HYH03_011940 [Edaphochlamys debaryana]|uniref:Uncharacterized protein n=1 Tax=Edaphochlamys debaryana TaxID=47281 RepID=A0A835XTP5_9CHLO|nr:hypothetical protein HYH03_011940 [Edaphochlamys debaryana]|eukprot:KAG2489487.1 hypothetical protein HYH03_011940 [Edaphochlamys debaryana]
MSDQPKVGDFPGAPASQPAADLTGQAQQMASDTGDQGAGRAPATASGPDVPATGGMALGNDAPMPPGPSQDDAERRRQIKGGDSGEGLLASAAEVPPAERGVGGGPAVHSLEEAAAEGARQREEQEFTDLGGPESGNTR